MVSNARTFWKSLMRFLMVYFFSIFLFIFNHYAWGGTTNNEIGSFQFQIIQSQVVLDHSNILKAKLINNKNGSVAIIIELKPAYGHTMRQLTNENIGKSVNLVYNKRVISTSLIQTPLGGRLLLTGFTRNEAQLFLRTLNAQESNEMNRKNPQTIMKKLNESEPRLIRVMPLS